MSYEDKSFAERPQAAPAEPWDSGRTMSPDPAWPIEARLHWYQVSGHILLLNCSEITRQKAAAAADREAGARLAAVEPQPAPGDPVAVLDDGEVLAMRAYSGGVIVIAFAPGAPAENADRLPGTMAAQCGVPVIAVTSVTALRAWTPAELDGKPAPGLGDRLGEAEEHIERAENLIDDYRAEHRRLTADNNHLRELLDEIGVIAANAPEDGDSFAVLEEIAMRAASSGIPDDEPPAAGVTETKGDQP